MPSRIFLSPFSERADASHHLIFFITGNPGLISYYDSFLGTLYQLLSSKPESSSDIFHIYGQSLAGFDDEDETASFLLGTPPYGLETQIGFTLSCLKDQRIPSGPQASKPYHSIILIGHSIGAYMLLEVLSQLHQSPCPAINIKGGILLFPTIINIAQSPSGLKATTLFSATDFPRRASLLAKVLLWPVPETVLGWLVGLVTGMPKEAVAVTMAFLRSRMGVFQALLVFLPFYFSCSEWIGIQTDASDRHLARDEMEQVREDKWGCDIWGTENADKSHKVDIPKLIFYFGEKVSCQVVRRA